MAIDRIRTDQDIVNGLVTLQPRCNGTVDSTDGSASGVHSRAQHIPTGYDPAQWGVLDGRYIVGPTGWSE